MYPYVETLKVGAAYAALMYLWPCIVFRGALRDKGLTVRFLFCAMVQPVLVSTAVLALGLAHVLNVWLVRALFWGALAWSLGRRDWYRRAGAAVPLRSLMAGSYGWKLFFFRTADGLAQRCRGLWRRYRDRAAEYLTLTAILLFGMAFFLNGAFQDYSFGCYDQYTHYAWTAALLDGEIFTAGVYPQGMHCFLYALHVLFGVKLHSCVLFLAGIHNSTAFLLSAYCLLKELFHSRHTTLFVLAAWLTFDGIGPDALEAMTRMAWTLPQEFAQHVVFLCPAVLVRYFREEERPRKWHRDENLLLLAAGVAMAVSAHYYVLIMVVVSCAAVVLAHLRELWPVRRGLRPICAGLYGLELGMLPMLAACAMGTDLEGSLMWGFNTLRGASSSSSVRPADPDTTSYLAQHNPLKELYENGYLFLFGEGLAELMVLLTLLAAAAAVYCVWARRRGKAGTAGNYLTLTALLTAYVVLYAMPHMGLPELVVIDRTLGVTQMLAIGAIGIPADLMIRRMEEARPLPRSWMALGCVLLYLLAYNTDFHQCTYWWLRRYNAAVVVTDQIQNGYPAGSYKIVSMLDEAYQVGQDSHEELTDFLEGVEEETYSIPAEYLFLYVEKRPIRRGQVHFLTAPRWLAQDNYEVYEGLWNQSQCPDVLKGEISRELAESEMPFYPKTEDNCNNSVIRSAICSEAYYWYQDFAAGHPAETNVYYEDEDFACYVIHQNPSAPLELAEGRGGVR